MFWKPEVYVVSEVMFFAMQFLAWKQILCDMCELVKVWRQTTSQILNGAQIHSQKWCWFKSTAIGGAIYR